MEKLIVEELCKRYGKSENLIQQMLKDTMNEGYNLKETSNIISDFFNKKLMQ